MNHNARDPIPASEAVVPADADNSKTDAVPTERLVAFIDILGFRSVLANPDTSIQQSILNALKEVVEQHRNFEVKVHRISDRERSISIFPAFTGFSDNVLISFDLAQMDAGTAYQALMLIRGTVCALAHRSREFGCLVRGAVTVGQLYHQDHVAFGIGLVEAYELESRTAFFPRVIVAPKVLNLFPHFASADGLSTDDRSMFRDADGYWCLDYMTAYLEYLGSSINQDECTARRAWALTTRAKGLEMAAQFAKLNQHRAAQNWAWFVARFEKSMLSVSPHRFDVNGNTLDFP